MLKAANNLEFEKAALLRDQVRELKRSTGQKQAAPMPRRKRSVTAKRGGHAAKRSGEPHLECGDLSRFRQATLSPSNL